MNEGSSLRIVIVSIAVAALVGLSFLAVYQSTPEKTVSKNQVDATAIAESTPTPKQEHVDPMSSVPESSLVRRVGKNSMMVFSIIPTRHQQIFDTLGKLLQRIAATNAWKKLNVDKELGNRLQDPDLDYLFKDLPPSSKDGIPHWFAQLQSLIMKINQIDFAISSEVRNVHPDIQFPVSILEVEFSNPTDLASFYNGFKKGFQEQIKKAPPKDAEVTFKHIDDSTLLVQIESKEKQIKIEIISGVRGARFYVMLGSGDNKLLQLPAALPLVESDHWDDISPAIRQNYGSFVYFNAGVFVSYVESIFEGIEPLLDESEQKSFQEVRKQLSASLGAQGNVITAGSSAITRAGVEATQCMTGEKEAFGLRSAIEYVKDKGQSNASLLLQRVLSEHSVIAFSINTGFADLLLQNAMQGAKMQAAGGASSAKELDAALEVFTLFQKKLLSLGHKEAALFLDAPRSGFIPSGGIALSGSTIPGKRQAAILREILSEIGKESPASERPTLSDVSSNDEQLVYTLSIKPEAPGGQVMISQGGEFLLITGGPEAKRISRDPGKTSEYAKNFVEKIDSVKAYLNESDYIGYLNLGPAIDVAKPSLGMMIASSPDAQIDFEDLSELLELFKFRAFYGQQSSLVGDSTACYNTLATVIPRD